MESAKSLALKCLLEGLENLGYGEAIGSAKGLVDGLDIYRT